MIHMDRDFNNNLFILTNSNWIYINTKTKRCEADFLDKIGIMCLIVARWSLNGRISSLALQSRCLATFSALCTVYAVSEFSQLCQVNLEFDCLLFLSEKSKKKSHIEVQGNFWLQLWYGENLINHCSFLYCYKHSFIIKEGGFTFHLCLYCKYEASKIKFESSWSRDAIKDSGQKNYHIWDIVGLNGWYVLRKFSILKIINLGR